MMLRGLEGALTGHAGSWSVHYPISYPIAHAFQGTSTGALQNQVYFWAALKIVISMTWAITIGLNATMGVAWHRFLAFFNVWFKKKATGGTALGALSPMASNGAPIDFEDPADDARFGVGAVQDFTWKGLLDFSTCTECGRCQDQCPAWNTEKPLSPKLLVMSLREHAGTMAPYLFAGGGRDLEGNEKLPEEAWLSLPELVRQEAERPLIGTAEENGVIDPDILWSCTTCGACVEQCPVDIEHVDHIVDMRRYQVMIESSFPSEAGTMLKNLEKQQNPWGMQPRKRTEWIAELDFEVSVFGETLEDISEVEYLYWVGCAGALEDRAKKTTKAFAELLHIAGVKFAVLGGSESCTGDPARRLGNEFLFQMLGQGNVEMLNEVFGADTPVEKRKIVATCPHCFNTLANEYPAARRALRRHPPHPAAGHPGHRGPAHPGHPDRPEHHLPRPLLPGPPQQGLHSAARDHRQGAGPEEHRDAPLQGEGLLLRRRRRAHVDGGAPRQAHQHRARRRGPVDQPRRHLHGVPVLPGDAQRLGHGP